MLSTCRRDREGRQSSSMLSRGERCCACPCGAGGGVLSGVSGVCRESLADGVSQQHRSHRVPRHIMASLARRPQVHTKDIIFPLRLNQDAIVIASVRASRLSRLALASRLSRLGSRLSLGCWQGWGPTQMPNQLETQPHTNGQNAGAGVVGLAHACPALSFCHRITQRALQPQHGVLWPCIVPAASSRTAASFSSRSARRDETWSSVELIVS